ncbi:MAG: haloalkane dehalogenase [Granulosicoccus sp.]|jgi:haloalkane dehalogenase
MDMIRTPDHHFDGLPAFPYPPNYVHVNGARMHYLDEGKKDGEVILCLHGEPTWCYLYRKFMPILRKNNRVIAPDFFGFGKSDKYLDKKSYSYRLHYKTLIHFIEELGLKDITLVVQDWGGLIGLGVVGKHPELFKRLVILNTSLPTGNRSMPLPFKLWQLFSQYWPTLPVGRILQWGTHKKMDKEVVAAYKAPFPKERYKAGARMFPKLVPSSSKSGGVHEMKRAREVLSKWDKPAFVMFSDRDPIMKGGDKFFRKLIPTAKDQPEVTIRRAGHFLQEDKGEDIAQHIADFMERT